MNKLGQSTGTGTTEAGLIQLEVPLFYYFVPHGRD
jgi:hypothetical protein